MNGSASTSSPRCPRPVNRSGTGGGFMRRRQPPGLASSAVARLRPPRRRNACEDRSTDVSGAGRPEPERDVLEGGPAGEDVVHQEDRGTPDIAPPVDVSAVVRTGRWRLPARTGAFDLSRAVACKTFARRPRAVAVVALPGEPLGSSPPDAVPPPLTTTASGCAVQTEDSPPPLALFSPVLPARDPQEPAVNFVTRPIHRSSDRCHGLADAPF